MTSQSRTKLQLCTKVKAFWWFSLNSNNSQVLKSFRNLQCSAQRSNLNSLSNNLHQSVSAFLFVHVLKMWWSHCGPPAAADWYASILSLIFPGTQYNNASECMQITASNPPSVCLHTAGSGKKGRHRTRNTIRREWETDIAPFLSEQIWRSSLIKVLGVTLCLCGHVNTSNQQQ